MRTIIQIIVCGALALMPVLGACRVDVDTVMQACIQHHPAHHSFSSG